MIQRMIGAAARAFLVALLIATPAVILPNVSADATQMVALLSLVAAVLTFVEYNAEFPSLLEFRDAPPFNRMRFAALFVTIASLSLTFRGVSQPTPLSETLTEIGASIGSMLNVPFSPVHLLTLLAPPNAPPEALALLEIHAGIAYLVSLVALALFVVFVRVLNWPIRHGAFNFWVNLPLFDPTGGGDVLLRLRRDAQVNVALGFLLPFIIPAVVQGFAAHVAPLALDDPQTMIWMITAWAFLPVSLIMRGVALMRIAGLIEEKRRRAYAQTSAQPV